MNLSMRGELANRFTSGSQRARNVTEAWGADNFFCPNCSSPKLDWLKPGTKANDYRCPSCGFWFQLKSKKSRIGSIITDGAYGAMMEAIRNDALPSFYFLHYEICRGRGNEAQTSPQEFQTESRDLDSYDSRDEIWLVRNLLLVPHFAFPPSAIIKRKPLSVTARRTGWIGCNFALNRIPVEARISMVTESQIVPEKEVREKFKRVKPLKDVSVNDRGWSLDVLNIVRHLGKKEFTNADVYAHERELEALHPDNRNIKAKIRQKLQILRDAKLLIHVSNGVWRLP
jgi:type II restriction enzyme